MSTIPSERFKDLSAAVQNCVVSLAVLIGGGWTLYKFVATHETERASRELFQQAQLLIKVSASEMVLADGGHCIASTVAVTNSGTRNVFLDYSGEPFSVRKIDFDARGNSSLGAELRQENLVSGSRVLRVGESVEYPFIVLVRDAGVYVVRFEIPIPPQEMPGHRGGGGAEGKPYWLGTTLINIEQTKGATRPGPGPASAGKTTAAPPPAGETGSRLSTRGG
jgi:hypothetical protein